MFRKPGASARDRYGIHVLLQPWCVGKGDQGGYGASNAGCYHSVYFREGEMPSGSASLVDPFSIFGSVSGFQLVQIRPTRRVGISTIFFLLVPPSDLLTEYSSVQFFVL